jgi:CBS domain containing-hemolysin-like protein
MLERFGTLPKVGDAVEIEGLRFEVAQVLERRIATVIVSRVDVGYDQPLDKG